MTPVKTPTQLPLTHDLLERADVLIAVMAADPEVRVLGLPTCPAVLRLAIARGLWDIERQYRPLKPASSPRWGSRRLALVIPHPNTGVLDGGHEGVGPVP